MHTLTKWQMHNSLVAQRVKHLPAMREAWVPSLGWEDPLEKEMATHSSTLAWKIPWAEEPGGLQSMGSQTDVHIWATSLHVFTVHPYPNAEHPVCKMTPYPQLLYKRTNFSYKHKGIVHLADSAWHTQLAFCPLPLFINRGEIHRRFTMSRSRVHSWLALSMFTVLGNRHLYLVPRPCHPDREPLTHQAVTLHYPSPPAGNHQSPICLCSFASRFPLNPVSTLNLAFSWSVLTGLFSSPVGSTPTSSKLKCPNEFI